MQVPPPPPPPPSWPAPWSSHPAPATGRWRARSAPELVEFALTLYRGNFRLLVIISALLQIPIQGLNLALQRWPHPAPAALSAATICLAVVSLFLIQPLTTAALTYAVSNIYLDRPADAAGSFQAAWPRVPALIGASLLILLFALGVGLTVGLFVVVALPLAVIVVPAAACALALVVVRTIVASPIIVVEKLRSIEGLQRSWNLVRGATPRVLGIILLTALAAVIAYGVPASLALLLFIVTGATAVGYICLELFNAALAILITPLFMVTIVIVYYDLRIRREGFDLEMLASSL